jgi:hypothetical protein
LRPSRTHSARRTSSNFSCKASAAAAPRIPGGRGCKRGATGDRIEETGQMPRIGAVSREAVAVGATGLPELRRSRPTSPQVRTRPPHRSTWRTGLPSSALAAGAR